MSRYMTKVKYTLIIILGIILMSGCIIKNSLPSVTGHPEEKSTASPTGNNTKLYELCNDLFIHMVSSDAITLNYTLSSPDRYGIYDYPKTLGEYDPDSTNSDIAYYENALAILNNIDYSSLNPEEKLTYDTLSETLSSYINIAPYYMYEEPLAPVSGIHVQLPVLLCEYHFYNEQAIQDYFTLIESIPGYFSQIIRFEAQKKSEGLFMSTATAEKVIAECKEFISSPDTNMLIQVFPDNIKKVNLTDKTRSAYISRNEQLIRRAIIPAYQTIINGLLSLIDIEASPYLGMCRLPDGKEYYSRLVHMQTNSDMTPDTIRLLLENTLNECRTKIATCIIDNPDAYEAISNTKYAAGKPEDIITYLKDNISTEYPALPSDAGRLNIKYVHPSLENTLSPAMYITPPIDCDVTDNIYINNSCCDDTTMFTTLAHEGYPGHLYQYEYYMQTNPHPLRLMLPFGGYSEGWATYAELFSYKIAGIDQDSAVILSSNKLATLCIYSMLDLGIHYYDWTYDDCAAYLSEFGIDNQENIDEIYGTIIAEPALYLKYTVGCLEFIQLENELKAAAGADYDPVSFHKAILETGPTWFEILKNKVKNTYFHH